ncbi:DUF6957 family protein [Pseudomonas fluorescens]|uniref:DUF6957 family protein n=1 Tax=Pseudomonas fluorescens TaxID=294 RepID=UPI00124210D7|nr:hypothetical protein [Pseudomonas fluorescens]
MESELIVDVLYGPARTFGGSGLKDDELIKLAREEFEGRSFCVVRNWMILDVMLPETQEQEIKKQGLQPAILYAHRAVFDSEARFSAGESVITSYQQSFEDCFFESKDTLYILAGRGARKHVSWPAVTSLRDVATVS